MSGSTYSGNEKIVQANGVDVCVQTFGDRADSPILLIHGATTSMLGWEDEFCERLTAGSRFIIRYDQRDTGRSVSYEPGARSTLCAIWSRTRSACSTPSTWKAPIWLPGLWAGSSPCSRRSTTPTGSPRSPWIGSPGGSRPSADVGGVPRIHRRDGEP